MSIDADCKYMDTFEPVQGGCAIWPLMSLKYMGTFGPVQGGCAIWPLMSLKYTDTKRLFLEYFKHYKNVKNKV